MTASSLARTPLYSLIQAQKAKFTEFSGWEMPVQFTGLKQEHLAVRSQVGMFDISHMGKFIFTGDHPLQSLDRLVPSDLSRLTPGRAQYTVLLNPEGGIIDDVIIYDQGPDKTVMIVNAATKEKDKTWLLSQLDQNQIQLTDVSDDQILIALQGPQAVTVLQPFLKADLTSLPAFGQLETELLGDLAFIARTGYTGEDGFEMMLSIAAGQALWRSLSEKGVIPCGLGARDTLRLEAAMGLYGQDMDDHTSPLEAGLNWLIHWEKEDFIGRSALTAQKAQGVTRRLVALEMEGRHIARHGYPVKVNDQVIGEVTSGTFSPTLEKAIALAYVPKELSKIGQPLAVEIRGKDYPGRIVKKPFYRSPHKP